MFVIVLISFIVACALNNETFGLLTTVPENVAVISGMTVVMKCRTNDTNTKIVWNAPNTENLPPKIFGGDRIASDWSKICYIDNSSSGQYDLIINSTMSAGTQYVCQEGHFGHENGNMGTAELIVLATDPNCSMIWQFKDEKTTHFNDANISLEMRCTVRYSGNWTPMMEWREEGCREPIYTGVNTTVHNATVTSTLTVSANHTYNLTRYICTTRFDRRDKPSSTTADNVPSYSHNWTSPKTVDVNENPTATSSSPKTEVPSQLTQRSIISVVAVLQGVLLVIVVLLLLRRRIKTKTPSSNHELRVIREADILQHTAQGTAEPDYGIDLFDAKVPACAVVSHHNVATEENSVAVGQPDLYATVNETEKSFADHNRETSQRSAHPVNQHRNIGADGTEYLAMKSTNCSQQQQMPMKNLFDTSTYAQIDHTITKVPPPPLNYM